MNQSLAKAPPLNQEAFLRAVHERISAAVLPLGDVGNAARQLTLLPGAKRARPNLCWLLASHLDCLDDSTVAIAAGIELIHSASLLHDDVIDESPTRRSFATANSTYGNVTAILAGDYALARGLEVIAPLGAEALAAATAVLSEMSLSAKLEIDHRRDPNLDLDTWRRIALGKTAALFGLCGRMVGQQAGGQPDHEGSVAHRLEQAARHFGVAFQMADDIQDYAQQTSESALDDLRNGNPSLPLVLALKDTPLLRRLLVPYWQSGSHEAATQTSVVHLLRVTGAFERAALATKVEVNAGREALATFAPTLHSQQILRWAEKLSAIPLDLLDKASHQVVS